MSFPAFVATDRLITLACGIPAAAHLPADTRVCTSQPNRFDLGFVRSLEYDTSTEKLRLTYQLGTRSLYTSTTTAVFRCPGKRLIPSYPQTKRFDLVRNSGKDGYHETTQ